MKIRRATEDDLEQIVRLSMNMWRMHQGEAGTFIDVSYITPNIAKKYFNQYLKGKNKALFVAEEKGKIIGVADVAIVKLKRFFVYRKAAYFDDLVVNKRHRRCGVATKLHKAREKFANELGAKMVQTRVYSFNVPAQELLKRRGFTNLYSEYFKLLD